jgi:ubiquinol-cytochrome c reductase cytochrome c1 subunit
LQDLVNFLVYVSEPAQLQRLKLGKYVIAFLIALSVLLYFLKKEFWKDVH